MAAQWTLSLGSSRLVLDRASRDQIEYLWTTCSSGWVKCLHFSNTPVYVDLDQMVLHNQSIVYTLARIDANSSPDKSYLNGKPLCITAGFVSSLHIGAKRGLLDRIRRMLQASLLEHSIMSK